ncbi:fimbrial protein [Klebsiella aerogenes]|uniref:fimbrial protein n=1 Tax=Klebsiella aerogenes TaxID=548 RepID=UPI002E33D92B|nr:fimbrial protein [Klebsiella aerogenes]MED7793089.1 fimbrial protein [Klebsiella aerogenes]
MKFAKVALVIAMGLAGISVANAADQGHGTVTFKGSIIDSPCSITGDTVEQDVPLGQVSNAALENEGTSTPVYFDIDLENCTTETAKSVQVTFTGAPDPTDSAILGLTGDASGAGVVIADSSGKQLDLGTPSVAQNLGEGSNTLTFAAYLKGDKPGSMGASSTIVPGDFQSTANFTLAYN